MNQSQQPDLKKMKADAEQSNVELKAIGELRDLLSVQFRTQLRNMHLAYIHAISQSGFELSFYDNGALKSIAPKGE